jgi:hypothetical protein
MLAATLCFLLNATPFPLPAVDGKALAVSSDQKVFRLPMRFEKVRGFYDEQFAKEKDVTVKLAGSSGTRTLTITSKRKGDLWTKAVVKEGELETVVDVTRVLVGDVVDVNGTGTPLVQFVFARSKEVEKAVDQTSDPLTR